MKRPAPGRRTPDPGRLLAAVLVLVTVLGAGCGDDRRDEVRKRVTAYVRSEQAVMERVRSELERANKAYLAYSAGEIQGAEAAAELGRAERTIAGARDAVTTLDPPAEAQRLHDGALRYLDANVALAGETARLARYVPGAEAALRPLGGANRRLQSELADADGSRAQGRALQRFEAAAGTTIRALESLEPPGILAAAHDDRIRRLTVTRRLAARLRRALLDQDAERVAVLLTRFRDSAEERRPSGLLDDQARAGYARRLQELEDRYADVQREQRRLEQSLG